eukprot:5323046-Ditylum_brightwellii.AAC.1
MDISFCKLDFFGIVQSWVPPYYMIALSGLKPESEVKGKSNKSQIPSATNNANKATKTKYITN